MHENDLRQIAAAGVLLIIIGLTWLFGPWVLVGAGAVLLVSTAVINIKED